MHNVILSPINTDDLIQRIAKATAEMMRDYSTIESEPTEDLPLTIKEASKIVGYTVPTLYGYCQRNEIPYHKKNNRLFFFKQELIEWIKQSKVKTKAEIKDEVHSYLTPKK